MKPEMKKLIIANLPYLLFVYLFGKLGQTYRLAAGADLSEKLLHLAAYAEQYPDECCKTDTDPETGCMEFDIAKGRFSFRLTAPYSEERREAARRYARENNAADRLK